MSRSATVWWNKQKRAWCTDIGGRRQMLAKGRSNKRAAVMKLKALMEEQQLLAEVNGAMSVARLCEEFLADAKEHRTARRRRTRGCPRPRKNPSGWPACRHRPAGRAGDAPGRRRPEANLRAFCQRLLYD
jgi:hypothetical protein